jgi:hypothetical protein
MAQRAATYPGGKNKATPKPGGPARALADFSADRRVLMLAAMALVVGTGGALAASVLVKLIALVTNLVWSGRLATLPAAMAHAARTPRIVAPPIGAASPRRKPFFSEEKKQKTFCSLSPCTRRT